MPSHKPFHLEACITTVDEAVLAASRGADRLELCARLETEGMTSDRALVQQVLDAVDIPLRVMVRETETGYEADEDVLQSMIDSIMQLADLPIDGFVLGLIKDNRIDREKMHSLIEACGHHHITFHKAIDAVADIKSEIDFLNTCKTVDTILSSGGEVRAADGIAQLLIMKGVFQGHVMAAGKILAADIPALHEQLGLNWYHGRAII
jgi:copper homeostasis protein